MRFLRRGEPAPDFAASVTASILAMQMERMERMHQVLREVDELLEFARDSFPLADHNGFEHRRLMAEILRVRVEVREAMMGGTQGDGR